MKKSRLLKIIVALLVVLLSFSVGIAVMANSDDSAKSLEIVSNNISNKGKIAIMYAVEAKGFSDTEKIEFTVWDSDPRLGDTAAIYSATKLVSNTTAINVGGVVSDYVIFTAPGVASKNMCDSYYVEVSSGNISSGIYEYSILEYLYERLYTCTNTEEQIKFYEHLLCYGEASQKLFDYKTDALPSFYKYVDVSDGVTLDGKSRGIYMAGTPITLTYTKELADGYEVSWEIFDENGNSVVVANNSTFNVSTHAICKPLLTTDSATVVDFEDVGAVSTFALPAGFSDSGASQYLSYVNVGTEIEPDYVLQASNGTGGTQRHLTINSTNLNGYSSKSFGEYVFSADIKYNYTPTALGTSESACIGAIIPVTSSGNDYVMLIYVYMDYTAGETRAEDVYSLRFDGSSSAGTYAYGGYSSVSFAGGSQPRFIASAPVENNGWFNLKLVINREETVISEIVENSSGGYTANGSNASTVSIFISDTDGELIASCENRAHYHNLYRTGIMNSELALQWRSNNSGNYTMQMDNVSFYGEKTVETEAEVLSAKGGADSIVVLIHDDGYLNTVNIMDALFEKYSLCGDVGLLAEKIATYNADDRTYTAKEGAVSDWKSVLSTGRWKITNHSMTHTWWGTATDNGDGTYTLSDDGDRLYEEIVASQNIFQELLDQRTLTFCYPGFTAEKNSYAYTNGALDETKVLEYIYSEQARNLINEYYISARTGNEDAVSLVDSTVDWGYISGHNVANSNLVMDVTVNNDGTINYTPGSILNKVDAAVENGELLILYTHQLIDVAADELLGYSYPANTAAAIYYEQLCKKLSEYVADGRVWNTHYEDAVMYMREAQTSTVKTSGSENGITVTLTDEMDNEIYNSALTVRVVVPEAWSSVKVTQNGTSVYTNAKSVDGKWVVDIDIIPDNGNATIIPM